MLRVLRCRFGVTVVACGEFQLQISGGKMDFVNGYLDAAVRFVGELVLALLPRWD